MHRERRSISPTGSYVVDVPIDLVFEVDDTVVSCWRPGSDVLLQLSSHIREHGNQVGALARLASRLEQCGARIVEHQLLATAIDGDVASALVEEDDGTFWLYAYVVWPELSVFATVSGPSADDVRDSWACESVRSLRRLDRSS